MLIETDRLNMLVDKGEGKYDFEAAYLDASAPVQTGSGAHPDSYTMGNKSFPGVKRPGRGVDHTPTSSAEVKERVELYLYTTSGPSWPVIG
jgi:hypothetical protein